MKIAVLTIVGALVTSTFAQTFNGVPACAQPCVINYLSGSTIAGCNSVDISCICSNSSFLSGIACCLASSCSVTDQQAATEYAQNLCKANGVTNLPTAVSCASTISSTRSGTAATAATVTSTPATTAAVATTSAASTSAASTTTARSGGAVQNVVNMGAGIAGGLVAVVGML